MKKTTLSLLLITALSLGASAQTNNTDQKGQWKQGKQGFEQNEKRFEEGMKRQGFTDDQIAKMKSANTDYATKMKSIREDKSLDETAKKAKLQALNDERNKQYETIMGKEKYNEYKTKFESMRGRYNNGDSTNRNNRQWNNNKSWKRNGNAQQPANQ